MPIWSRLRAVQLALVLALAGSSAAQALSPADYGCDRPINFAYYEFGALFHAGVGIDVDVIAELERRTGCVFETRVMPRAQIWKDLEAGLLDGTNSGIRTEARRNFAYFIPYLGWKNTLVTRLDVAASMPSIDDIIADKTVKIGVVKGYVHGPFYDFRLKIADGEKRVIRYLDQAAIYRALQADEVQAIISPTINYSFYLPRPEDQARFVMLDASPTPPIPHNLTFSTKRFNNAQINIWARLFEALRLDGTLLHIYQAHLPPGVASAILHY